jgi:release factor glutamine methyltransferase
VIDDLVVRLRAAGCVFAEDEAEVLRGAARSPADLERLVARRVAGEPLEVVVGFAELCGVRVQVDAGVFVPRARTALMVRTAVEHLAGRARGSTRPVVVDLCCGTGAVGLAVRAGVGDVELVASDVDPAAVACARRSVEPVGGTVVEGDLDAPLPRGLLGRVDALCCNAPYVPTDAIATMPPEARDHEHRVALDGGDDGLVVVRRALAASPRWLAPGGLVVVEVGTSQVDAALQAARAAGLEAGVRTDDEVGATVVVGVLVG